MISQNEKVKKYQILNKDKKRGVFLNEEQDLLDIFKDVDNRIKILITPVIKEIVFLKKQLNSLRELPFIRVSEKNKSLQKATPAAKQYKEFLQQYTNCIRILSSFIELKESEEADALLEGIRIIKERYGKG